MRIYKLFLAYIQFISAEYIFDLLEHFIRSIQRGMQFRWYLSALLRIIQTDKNIQETRSYVSSIRSLAVSMVCQAIVISIKHFLGTFTVTICVCDIVDWFTAKLEIAGNCVNFGHTLVRLMI